ncbi:MAG: uracil-DNA glycosylase [Pseudomonadota bacterium]|nr:uracil-DNA glycosylase [Pseudomonadota bacterium]
MSGYKQNLKVLCDMLEWQLEAGIDECIVDEPTNQLVASPIAKKRSNRSISATSESNDVAINNTHSAVYEINRTIDPHTIGSHTEYTKTKSLALSCSNLAELESAVNHFEGCSLKNTATNTVFSDGNSQANIMFIGEAPGADEDLKGKPFVGPSGQLFDKMIGSIGFKRQDVYITNLVFWRPPGNRNPTTNEIAICFPFVQRQIELLAPDVLVLLGGAASKAILDVSQGITRLRGKWHSYEIQSIKKVIPAMPFFHPAYLLRSPIHKREAWIDLLSIKDVMD